MARCGAAFTTRHLFFLSPSTSTPRQHIPRTTTSPRPASYRLYRPHTSTLHRPARTPTHLQTVTTQPLPNLHPRPRHNPTTHVAVVVGQLIEAGEILHQQQQVKRG